MKFMPSSKRNIVVGDYVCYIPNNIPALKIYGYVRNINGMLHVQSKNCIQLLADGHYHFKPSSKIRFFKTPLNNGKITKLS